jgi:hypothetical protein
VEIGTSTLAHSLPLKFRATLMLKCEESSAMTLGIAADAPVQGGTAAQGMEPLAAADLWGTIRVVTIVRFEAKSQASNLSVTLHTTLPRDDEECRLFGVYEASSGKEHAAASTLLSSHHSVSHSAYMKLLGDLRAIRAECNEDMLAIAAHHKKMLELPTLH